jgi:ATP-binding cassette, subfamily B, multidrug efflux pump
MPLGPVSQGSRRPSTRLQGHTSRKPILLFAGLLVAISLVKGIFLYAQRWILIGISREIEFDLRNDLFRHLEKQDSGFYQRYRTGDIMARMTNDLNAVRMLLGPALMYSANTVFFTVFALYFLLRISPWLTLVALAPMPLASILVQYLGRRIHDRFERIQASFSDISSQAQENYSGARLIRAFAREESQIGLFERLNREYIARSLRLVQLMGMLWPTLEFILGVSMVITLLAGGHLVIAHRITVGQFVAFNTYMIHAHLAHHRRGLGGEPLPARHRLGEAHRRVAPGRARHRRQRRRSGNSRMQCSAARSSSAI